MFGNLFKKKKAKNPAPAGFVVAQLNARIQPLDRDELFDEPLDDALRRASLGEVSGGGTMQGLSGEVEFCDIEIAVGAPGPDAEARIIEELERLGAPKGSKLMVEADGREVPFGVTEGLAVYLNGTDLPDEVYKQCDSNFVYSELERLLEGSGRVLSHWQGPTETALYLYGKSFSDMQARIADFVASYPLCQKCRIEQIA